MLQLLTIGLYILGLIGKLLVPSNPTSHCLPLKSKIMRFLGHRFYPKKHGFPLLSAEKISEKRFQFAVPKNPQVTLLVLCSDSLSDLVNFLESLERSCKGVEKELILIMEEGNEEVVQYMMKNIEGVSVRYSSYQNGIRESINLAVSEAKGEYFTILKPAVLLQGDWLQVLLTEFDKDQNIGMVSAKVLSSDGLLYEAGSFIDFDFQVKSYGNSDFPERPKYNFIRELECASGWHSLIRKSDFEQVGGIEMDESLSKSFSKFSLAFRQKLGKKIVYTPQAEMIKLDSPRQMVELSESWEVQKEGLSARSSSSDANARKLLSPKSMLFIDIGLPEYDRDSGSLRAFYLLKLLKELGNHVIIVPRKGIAASPYHEELINLGIEVLYGFPDRKGMFKELKSLLPSIDFAWICRPQLNSEFEWIFKVNPRIKWIFDTIDLHYVRLEREAELFGNKRLMRKSSRFKRLELAIASKADLTLTVTEDEKGLLNDKGIKNVAVIPNVHEPHQIRDYPSFAERKGLLFIGSYHHPPNIDAVKWWIEEIMPIVWAKFKVPVTLLGDAPSKEVKALENELVKVPGYVRDIDPYFTSHRVFVAPLRYGAGMKGKIGQSLAYKLPIVTTGIGAEGVGLTHGLDVLIADDKETFAQQIINVYQDEQLWETLASNSQQVLASYSPSHIKGKLQVLLERMV
ncbi:glycosyltransferase [Algoriphagus sp. AGSA1]|uniref:glycosyltransferase n=1 Tax=Algoriphagus sp. AGSA1 TaxID=2907213 RepID=UPI001F1E41D9|nr:glycosyltransferase [Algoriphagus sp. AGSA1]MCE7057565.1 glycosyltransferase [Algoriphagus sp. AGSA1]